MNTWIYNNWLKVVAIVMLVLAPLVVLPFAYYQLMSWVVLGAALMTAWQAKRMNMIAIAWLFLLVAVVFNPFASIYLKQSQWHIVDFVTAGIFLLSLFVIREKNQIV